MALNNVNTLVTLHDELEIYCNSHYQIQRFKFEFEEQLENFSTEGKEFPILYAVPQSFGKDGMTDIHTIRIYVLSRLNRDRDNTLDNVNDTSLILNDTIKYWNSSNRNSDILLTNDPIGTPVNNSQLDYLQGYYADFDFELKSYSRCDIPIPDGVPRVGASGSSYIEPFLTCSSLGDCVTFTNNIDNLQNQINNLDAEKWTLDVDLDGTELDFTRNDGSTYSVDLQPLIDQLETDVLTNSNDISTNQTDIGDNLSLINTNITNIGANETDISNLVIDVSDNLSLINTNITDINNLELNLLNYLPLTGGQITGDLSVTGDFEVLGTTTTIGTQTIQALDNNFTLNYGGTHTSANLGGITIQDGVSAGNDSSWLINSDGNWYTNQNVGIGTSTPTHKLTTGYGTGIPEDGIALYGTTDQTTNYQRSVFYNTGDNVGVFDSQFGGTGVSGWWSFKINGLTRVEIDSQQLINYGNLFFVDDNLKTIGRPNSTFRPKAVYVGTTGVQIGALSSLPKAQMLDVYGGGYFQDNVGIGTTTPGHKLHVAGDVKLATLPDGTNGLIFERLSSNIWRLNTDGVGPVLTVAGNTLRLHQGVIVQRQGLTVAPTIASSILGKNAIDVEHTWNSSSFDFASFYMDITDTLSTADSKVIDIDVNTTNVFNVGKDGSGYFAGDVGIGTKSPNSPLEIKSSTAEKLRLNANAGGTPANYMTFYDAGGRTGGYGMISYGDDNISLWNDTGGAFIISTSGPVNPRIYIEGAGNVGIGTTTPQTKLDVDGEITVGIERWTIDLMTSLSTTIYASESLSITLVEDIVNSPTTTITLNNVVYTLGDPIVSGDEIGIVVSTPSVIKLKIEK